MVENTDEIKQATETVDAPASSKVPASALPGTRPERPAPRQQPQVHEGPKLGRNDLCWCGSGKKYKKCHGENE
jgi:preprotein translocase subunit SecA